ncbi:MAG TPA: thermonuclease family protein [Candidatus Saccharimonadales bacterium]|nr:thermonuclease family protein [Candidatus Saccharimonadales bacterium]
MLRPRKPHAMLAGVLAMLVVGGWWIVGQAGRTAPPAQVLQQDQPGLYSINHFIDGDTVAVDMNGHVESVRFIGIDTPETHKPDTPVQCYGPQAAAYTKATIGRNRVRLVSDSLSTDRDRYNRLLRYVYLPDGTLLNEQLVRQGYAFYYPYFPFSKSAAFAADEDAAMVAHLGLWAHCHPTPTDSGGYVSNAQDS